MRRRFEEELKELHVELIRMGSLCEQAIALSSSCLLYTSVFLFLS